MECVKRGLHGTCAIGDSLRDAAEFVLKFCDI